MKHRVPVPPCSRQLKSGEPCDHQGCLSHVSHPCEGCGRIGGQGEYVPRVSRFTEQRQTGRTTQLLKYTPKGGIFVWCNNYIEYPKELARRLERLDIQVKPASWLGIKRVQGLNIPVVIDHTLWQNMTTDHNEALHYLEDSRLLVIL